MSVSHSGDANSPRSLTRRRPRNADAGGMDVNHNALVNPCGSCPRYLSRQNYPAAGGGGVGRVGTRVLACDESGSRTSGSGDVCDVGLSAVRVEIRSVSKSGPFRTRESG